MESAPSPAPASSSPPPASSPAPTSPDRNPKIQTAANFDSSTYTKTSPASATGSSSPGSSPPSSPSTASEQLFCRRGDLFCSCEVFGKVLETFGVRRRRFGKNKKFEILKFKHMLKWPFIRPPPPTGVKLRFCQNHFKIIEILKMTNFLGVGVLDTKKNSTKVF